MAPPRIKQEVFDEFLKRIETRSVRDVCSDDDMPAQSSVYDKLLEDTAFAEKYARATERRADHMFDEMLEIADDGSNDWMERQEEQSLGWRENGEALNRSRLRVDTRKWILARMQPRKYGDKMDVNTTGSISINLGEHVTKL